MPRPRRFLPAVSLLDPRLSPAVMFPADPPDNGSLLLGGSVSPEWLPPVVVSPMDSILLDWSDDDGGWSGGGGGSW